MQMRALDQQLELWGNHSRCRRRLQLRNKFKATKLDVQTSKNEHIWAFAQIFCVRTSLPIFSTNIVSNLIDSFHWSSLFSARQPIEAILHQPRLLPESTVRVAHFQLKQGSIDNFRISQILPTIEKSQPAVKNCFEIFWSFFKFFWMLWRITMNNLWHLFGFWI